MCFINIKVVNTINTRNASALYYVTHNNSTHDKGRVIYLQKLMLTPSPSLPDPQWKKNIFTSWTIMLSSGSGLPNNWHKSHKRFGYVNLCRRISSASKPPATVPFGHLYTAGIERASCSTLRLFLLNLCQKVVRFEEFEYLTFVDLCCDNYNVKSLLPKQVDTSLLFQNFKVNFKTKSQHYTELCAKHPQEEFRCPHPQCRPHEEEAYHWHTF